MTSAVFILQKRCGGSVYEAEKIPVKNDVYHKRCFNCHRCNRALVSGNTSIDT